MGTTDPIRSALTETYVQTLLQIKAKQLARRPEFRGADPADIEHDLISHVLKQADRYDPARGAVHTFIDRVVNSAAAMLVRDRNRLKRAAGFHAVSLDTPVVSEAGHATTMVTFVVDEDHRRRRGGRTDDEQHRAELAIDLTEAMGGLTPQQREIATRLASASEADVARQLGISRLEGTTRISNTHVEAIETVWAART
ncbi:MAG: hypothetical protein ACOC95_00860 [Planctomycetota bacterium]